MELEIKAIEATAVKLRSTNSTCIEF